jgi:DNA-binding NarL/FixJ family response regulator
MGATLKRPPKHLPAALWKSLPPVMRVLYITSRQRTGSWLAEAFASDSASVVELEEASGSAAGLSRLRDEVFDAVLLSHEPGELDALELIEGYRAGGADEPILVLGAQSEQEMAALCYEVGADGYICANTTTTRTLLWMVARAIQRHQLIRENRRLSLAEQQRLVREHEEANELLIQQRALISDLEAIRRPSAGPTAGSVIHRASDDARNRPDRHPLPDLPEELVHHYRELLRAHVIMGSGNLGEELARLAELLATARMTARQAMSLHLRVLEELVHGLGARSTRHVMTRADLLVLEIMIHLAESYRQRYHERLHPPLQLRLPGFEQPGSIAESSTTR